MAKSTDDKSETQGAAEVDAAAGADVVMSQAEPEPVLQSAEQELANLVTEAVKSALEGLEDRLTKAGLTADELADVGQKATAKALESAGSFEGVAQSEPGPQSPETVDVLAAEIANQVSARLSFAAEDAGSPPAFAAEDVGPLLAAALSAEDFRSVSSEEARPLAAEDFAALVASELDSGPPRLAAEMDTGGPAMAAEMDPGGPAMAAWDPMSAEGFAESLLARLGVASEISPGQFGAVAVEPLPISDVLTRLRTQRDALSEVIDRL